MENKSARAKVQAFGGFLTAMVIPNIGAFIAWGFITALFIPTGWLPNEHFAKIVGPMITYLLPVMIGSTGGASDWRKTWRGNGGHRHHWGDRGRGYPDVPGLHDHGTARGADH